jgi:hypothetical protein
MKRWMGCGQCRRVQETWKLAGRFGGATSAEVTEITFSTEDDLFLCSQLQLRRVFEGIKDLVRHCFSINMLSLLMSHQVIVTELHKG